MVRLFEGARKNFGYVVKATLLGILFWLAQFAYQFFFVVPDNLGLSLVRSFAFSGATLIGIALIIGPLFVLFPKLAFIKHRRTFGVIGFAFILLHTMAVTTFLFGGNILSAYTILNPFENPVVFGGLAYFIFLLLFLTSTDWAVQKLSPKNWKRLHRLVYFAFILAVLHFLLTSPIALQNLAGYLLLAVTFLAIVLELAAFFKTVSNKKSTKDALIGAFIIIFGLILFWMAFFN